MHDDVRTVFNWAAQIRGWNRVVHNQRHPRRMGDLSHRAQIDNIAERIADGFTKHRFGFFINQGFEAVRVAIIGKPNLDAELGQGMRKQVVSAAV